MGDFEYKVGGPVQTCHLQEALNKGKREGWQLDQIIPAEGQFVVIWKQAVEAPASTDEPAAAA